MSQCGRSSAKRMEPFGIKNKERKVTKPEIYQEDFQTHICLAFELQNDGEEKGAVPSFSSPLSPLFPNLFELFRQRTKHKATKLLASFVPFETEIVHTCGTFARNISHVTFKFVFGLTSVMVDDVP